MLDETDVDQIKDESAETAYQILHHQVPALVPPFPEGSRTLDLVITSPSPQSQPQQSGSSSTPHHTGREMLLEQQNIPEDLPDTTAGHSASSHSNRGMLQQRHSSPDPQTHAAAAGRRRSVFLTRFQVHDSLKMADASGDVLSG